MGYREPHGGHSRNKNSITPDKARSMETPCYHLSCLPESTSLNPLAIGVEQGLVAIDREACCPSPDKSSRSR
jgi:hypothetical protein